MGQANQAGGQGCLPAPTNPKFSDLPSLIAQPRVPLCTFRLRLALLPCTEHPFLPAVLPFFPGTGSL